MKAGSFASRIRTPRLEPQEYGVFMAIQRFSGCQFHGPALVGTTARLEGSEGNNVDISLVSLRSAVVQPILATSRLLAWVQAPPQLFTGQKPRLEIVQRYLRINRC